MDIALLNQNFYEIAQTFNLADPNILRKFVHGLTTADTCFAVACSQYMDKDEREFIYACGLLHDIGRMIQWSRFASFSDSRTIPHEELGVEYLKKGPIKRFFETKEKQRLALELISYHPQKYRGKDKDIKKFLPILQNADNYANIQYNATGMQRLWVNQDGVTPIVLERFHKRKNLHGTPIHTKLDRILQFLSRTYALEINMLRRDMLGRKYINAIYDVYSPQLNDQDREILYKECWQLKRELAILVQQHDQAKKVAMIS